MTTWSPKTYGPSDEYDYYILDVFYNWKLRSEVAQRLNGKPIIDLSSGQNLQSAPAPLLEELARDIYNPLFYIYYDNPAGSFIWRKAIADYETLRAQNACCLSAANALVTVGITSGFYCIARYFAAKFPGSKVLIPVPSYLAFGESIINQGLEPVEIVSGVSPRLMPSAEDFEKALLDRNIKLVYLTPLGNPTGTCITAEYTRRLIAMIKEHDSYLLWDETATTLVFPGHKAPNILALASEMDALHRVIIVAGPSKDRSMPGFRIGWLIAEEEMVRQMAHYNRELVCNPPVVFAGMIFKEMLLRSLGEVLYHARDSEDTTSAVAEVIHRFLGPSGVEVESEIAKLLPLLEGNVHDFFAPFRDTGYLLDECERCHNWLEHCLCLFQSNSALVTSMLKDEIEEISEVQGGFNLFVKLRGLKQVDQRDFVTQLFVRRGVEIVPGPVFGLTQEVWQTNPKLGPWFRITFSTLPDILQDGLSRLLEHKYMYQRESGRNTSGASIGR